MTKILVREFVDDRLGVVHHVLVRELLWGDVGGLAVAHAVDAYERAAFRRAVLEETRVAEHAVEAHENVRRGF